MATRTLPGNAPDLDRLPDDGTRYEIIEGELFRTRTLRCGHQKVADNICAVLNG